MKRVAGSIGIALLLVIAVATMSCSKDTSAAAEKALAERDLQTSAPHQQASAPRHETLVMPTGTSITAVLQTSLSTDANSTGDAFVATTVEPIIVDGRTVVRAGSRIDGVLRDVQASGRTKDRARMTLVFQEVVDSAGRTHSISALPLTIKAASELHNDVLKIAGGSAAGAVIGALTGKKNGVVIGAAAGATAGTVVVLATKGHEVELNPGMRLNVQMTGPTSFEVAIRQ